MIVYWEICCEGVTSRVLTSKLKARSICEGAIALCIDRELEVSLNLSRILSSTLCFLYPIQKISYLYGNFIIVDSDQRVVMQVAPLPFQLISLFLRSKGRRRVMKVFVEFRVLYTLNLNIYIERGEIEIKEKSISLIIDVLFIFDQRVR